ncbi:MAG TPA: addiction module protein [Longimicrobiaceae bacterium]
MDYPEIEAVALLLPPDQRSRLIERLMDSLDGEEDGGRWVDTRAERAWMAEIQRRMEEIECGDATLIPHEQVMAEMWARFGHRADEES